MSLRKTLLYTCLLIANCLAISLAFAQQLPQYSQYLLNDYSINPAVAGSRPHFEAKANQRNQWQGITDAPRTFILSVNGPLKYKNVGVGGSVFTDITGPTRRIGANFSYAYGFKLTNKVKLAMSLSGGLLQFAIDGSKVTTKDPGDPYFSRQLQTALVPDFGFGLYSYGENFYFGFSAPQLTQNKFNFFVEDKRLSKLEDHYFVSGGYRYRITDDYEIEPSVLAKYVSPAPVQFDFSTRIIFRDQLWLGATFRTSDAYSAYIGYSFQDNLMFGYSYDYTFSGLRKYTSGTHELMIGLKFVANKNKNQSLLP